MMLDVQHLPLSVKCLLRHSVSLGIYAFFKRYGSTEKICLDVNCMSCEEYLTFMCGNIKKSKASSVLAPTNMVTLGVLY